MLFFKELETFKKTGRSPLSDKLVTLRDALKSLKMRMQMLKTSLVNLKVRLSLVANVSSIIQK